MSAGKHTPGPWRVEPTIKKGFNIYDADKNVPCIARLYNARGNGEADAALIAAAPELLEALEEVLNAYDASRDDDPMVIEDEEIRALIAKARGEG